MHPDARAGKAYRQAELERQQAKRNELEAQGANIQLQFMLKSANGKLKAPPGWEWAEKLKEQQHG